MTAHKHDQGKPRLGLVPPGLIERAREAGMMYGQYMMRVKGKED